MKVYIKTNEATTNTFGLHTQPRKTTRYTNILKLLWGGGGGGKEKEPKGFLNLKNIFRKKTNLLIFVIK